jgi:hypothetical protein
MKTAPSTRGSPGRCAVTRYATDLLVDGHGIPTIHERLGHHNVGTTMICTHVPNPGPSAVRSAADRILGP